MQHPAGIDASTKKGGLTAADDYHSPPIDFERHYEDLRGAVVAEGVRPNTELGLALFIREGMTAWMRAWPRDHPVPQPTGGADRGAGRILSRGARSDVVTVLVEMALGARRQVAP